MRIDVLTLFPEIFSGYLSQSILHKSIQKKLLAVHLHNFRDWAEGPHKKIDDRPYGGGSGMVMMVKPIVEAVEQVLRESAGELSEQKDEQSEPKGGVLASGSERQLILLSPVGQPLKQPLVETLATKKQLIMMCGRYEGFDQRIVKLLNPLEVSVGDYVLNGGEVAAMVLIDAVTRLLPGVLGDEHSGVDDSFSSGNRLLEYPHYTRPSEYRGLTIPPVLLSGNHQEIDNWRREQSLKITGERREDLLRNE